MHSTLFKIKAYLKCLFRFCDDYIDLYVEKENTKYFNEMEAQGVINSTPVVTNTIKVSKHWYNNSKEEKLVYQHDLINLPGLVMDWKRGRLKGKKNGK